MNGEVNNGFSFGDFEVDPDHRLLFRDCQPVPLKPKAFDLLLALVENKGKILAKNELLDMVWKDQFVEENNLTVHIAALRKALGEKKNENRFIVTVPGKGYQFVADLDAAANGEIVIESHEFERIVVDEFELVNGDATQVKNSWPTLSLRRRLLWIGGSAILVAAVVGWSTFSAWNAPGTKATSKLAARTFSTTGIPHRVAISNDGRTLVYVRRLKGKDSIWIGDIEANSSIQVTPDSNRLHESIDFSPDGRTLYFVARDENHRERTLMSIPIYGGAVTDLITGVLGMSFSPDGREIAYIKKDPVTGRNSLFTADAGSGGNEQIIYQPQPPVDFADTSLSWSPKENAITVALSDENGQGCDLTNIGRADGVAVRLVRGQCSGSSNLAWLKDGSGIVMTGGGTQGERSQIWLMDLLSGEKRRVTNDATSYAPFSLSTAGDSRIVALATRNFPSIWSGTLEGSAVRQRILNGAGHGEGAYGVAVAPDGKVLFTMSRAKSIWEIGPDGSNQRELVASEPGRKNEQINVSPDNRYIVFESNRSGSAEIRRTNRDGSDPVQLTAGGGNSAPVIVPDGRSVLYMSLRHGKNNIWSVPIDGGGAVQLTTANCTWPDVSPDGKRFVCGTGAASDGPNRKLNVYDISGGEPTRSFEVPTNSALYNRIRWAPDNGSIIYKDVVDGLWQQSLNGGKPVKLPGFEDERVFHFTFGPDGKLFYAGGVQMRQIVILENYR